MVDITQEKTKRYKCDKFWQTDGIYLVTDALQNLDHIHCFFTANNILKFDNAPLCSSLPEIGISDFNE